MTRNGSLAVSAALALGFAVGCSPTSPKHTTEWYQQHPDAAQKRLAECDRLGLADRDADCLNAQQGATMAALHGKPSVSNPYAK